MRAVWEVYPVASMYSHMCNNGTDKSFKQLWKTKYNAIDTKDNMTKIIWVAIQNFNVALNKRRYIIFLSAPLLSTYA
jgi:hypothetical protein